VNGTGIFSDNGNTLIISGFSDPSSPCSAEALASVGVLSRLSLLR